MNLMYSKKGLPCLWESGGGYSNTGSATIIANADGTKPFAIYVRKAGQLSCSEHALIPVNPGMFIIEASHHRGDFDITISRITTVSGEDVGLEKLYEFSCGEWDKEPDFEFQAAITAAFDKATCYHCRTPYYIQS